MRLRRLRVALARWLLHRGMRYLCDRLDQYDTDGRRRAISALCHGALAHTPRHNLAEALVEVRQILGSSMTLREAAFFNALADVLIAHAPTAN